MAIQKQTAYFIKLLEEGVGSSSANKAIRQKLADKYDIVVHYDPISTPRVITKTVIKYLKQQGIVSKLKPAARDPSTTSSTTTFEIEELEDRLVKIIEDEADKAYNTCYDDSSLTAEYRAAFGDPTITFTNRKHTFPAGGSGYEDRTHRATKARGVADQKLIAKAVQEVVLKAGARLKAETGGRSRTGKSLAQQGDEMINLHTPTKGQAVTLKDFKSIRQNPAGVHSHDDFTVAILNYMRNVGARSFSSATIPGGVTVGMRDPQSRIGNYTTKAMNIVGAIKVQGKSINSWINGPTQNLTINIKYTDQAENVSEENRNKDLKKLRADLVELEKTQLELAAAALPTADYTFVEGSKSFRQRQDDAVIDMQNETLAKSLKKNKSVKLKKKPKKRTKVGTTNKKDKERKLKTIKSKHKNTKRSTGRVKTEKLGLAAALGGGRRTPSKQKVTTDNRLSLLNLINEALPGKVAGRMQRPRLVYRTGRFASSAEATAVNIGQRGGISVDYTYQKNPYEVFEPGNGPLANQYRDPKHIIGKSIREIATVLTGKKFITTRRI